MSTETKTTKSSSQIKRFILTNARPAWFNFHSLSTYAFDIEEAISKFQKMNILYTEGEPLNLIDYATKISPLKDMYNSPAEFYEGENGRDCALYIDEGETTLVGDLINEGKVEGKETKCVSCGEVGLSIKCFVCQKYVCEDCALGTENEVLADQSVDVVCVECDERDECDEIRCTECKRIVPSKIVYDENNEKVEVCIDCWNITQCVSCLKERTEKLFTLDVEDDCVCDVCRQ